MFIAKQNDKIIQISETKAELEKKLLHIKAEIEETKENYTFFNGVFLTDKELEVKKREQHKAEILDELDKIDLKTIRAIRANDTEFIEKFEKEAEILREELRGLE